MELLSLIAAIQEECTGIQLAFIVKKGGKVKEESVLDRNRRNRPQKEKGSAKGVWFS